MKNEGLMIALVGIVLVFVYYMMKQEEAAKLAGANSTSSLLNQGLSGLSNILKGLGGSSKSSGSGGGSGSGSGGGSGSGSGSGDDDDDDDDEDDDGGDDDFDDGGDDGGDDFDDDDD